MAIISDSSDGRQWNACYIPLSHALDYFNAKIYTKETFLTDLIDLLSMAYTLSVTLRIGMNNEKEPYSPSKNDGREATHVTLFYYYFIYSKVGY